MNFRSIITPVKANFPLDYVAKTIWLGSCFTEAIGVRTFQRKLPALVNPFGNIFSPLALALHLERSLIPKPLQENELIFHNNVWHSWHHHGSNSCVNKDMLIQNTLQSWTTCGHWLKDAKTLFITLGSAWVYEYVSNGLLVANCHKAPNTKFNKRLLTVAEIVTHFENALELCYKENKQLQVVLTVSPVKHLRDGIVENNRSKSTLLLAAHALSEKLKYVSYYPAYELVNDDLRDYRFYKEDLAHPNEMAEQYVWEHFCHTYFNAETIALMKEVESVLTGLQHKPKHNENFLHQTFLNNLLNKIKYLQSLGVEMKEETEQLKKQIL